MYEEDSDYCLFISPKEGVQTIKPIYGYQILVPIVNMTFDESRVLPLT